MVTLTDLRKRIGTLSPTAVRFVARMVESLSSPPTVTVREPDTWITGTPDWIEYFGLALSVHHGTTTEPLAQKGFETVFRNACESVGWNMENPVSETRRFLDIVLRRGNCPAQKLSLKSTAAQRLSHTTAHISKLTEAAWIQDMRTARDRRQRTLALFREYMDAVGLHRDAARVSPPPGDSVPISTARNSDWDFPIITECVGGAIQRRWTCG